MKQHEKEKDRVNIEIKHSNITNKGVKPMTCVIGMYCNNNNNAIIVSDSRAMLEIDFSLEQKIFKINDSIVYSGSGYSGMSIELLEKIAVRKKEEPTLDMLDIMTAEMYQMYDTYKIKTQMFPKDNLLLSAIVGTFGKKDEKPRLYCLCENGWLEPYNRKFRAIGDGERYAQQILMHLYKPNISIQKAIEIGVHTIGLISLLDASVDNNIQIATIGNRDIEMWNVDKNGDFIEKNPKIEDLKKKINGIEEKRAMLFDLMLSNKDDLKKIITDTLEEYSKSL